MSPKLIRKWAYNQIFAKMKKTNVVHFEKAACVHSEAMPSFFQEKSMGVELRVVDVLTRLKIVSSMTCVDENSVVGYAEPLGGAVASLEPD